MTPVARAATAALFAICAIPASAQTPASGPRIPDPPALTAELKRRTFDLVWETMRERYYDPSFKGLSWRAVREEYEADALAADDHADFHAILNQMVKRPGDSHLAVIPPPMPGSPASGSRAGVGIELVPGGDRALVARVEPNGPAARAGVAPGDEIVAIDGVELPRIDSAFVAGKAPEQMALARTQAWLAASNALRGGPNTEIRLTLRDHSGVRDVRLTRAPGPAHAPQVRPSFRLLDETTGLLTLTTFHTDIDALLDQTFTDCRTCTRLIIDLRGNGGGYAANVVKLLDRVMAGPGSAGIMITAAGPEPLAFQGSGEAAFAGEITVLIDGMSASAAEVFSAAVQDLGRGRVIGWRSGGAVLLSDIQPLPTGGSQLFPIAVFQRATGLPLEGVGVVPDVVVTPSGADLREGTDAVLRIARGR
jgi:carboxyl-terminal processing protease